MSTVSQDQPAPAVGPRAMAEQAILCIIWPPDGRPAWEDRHKIPRIEQALGHLLDIVESDDVKPAAIKARESQKLTAQIIDLRRQGLTMAQIAEVTGLTEYAVIHRISNSKKTQTAKATGAPAGYIAAPNQLCDICGKPDETKGGCSEECARENAIIALQGEPIPPAGITATDLPAALRSAAPDQLVEANKMIASADSSEAKPPSSAADHIVEANEMVADTDATLRNVAQIEQAQPKTEQVARPAAALQEEPKPDEKPQDLEQKQPPKSEKVPLTDEQKAKILELHAKGVNNHDIAVQLGIKDSRQVQGTVIARRKTAENVPAVQQDDTSTKPAEDVMLLQQPKEPEDPEGKRPEPKSISRAELDQKIWGMHKAGKDPDKISDELCAEGLYYGSGTVRARLIAQGAKI